MNILFLLVPLAIALAGLGVWGFWWAVKSCQFDDVETPALRIGAVARRTGVAVTTLRAWESRYGVLRPGRTEGGHRLYSEEDYEARERFTASTLEPWLTSPSYSPENGDANSLFGTAFPPESDPDTVASCSTSDVGKALVSVFPLR